MDNTHKEYTIEAFKKLCNETLQNLPEGVKDKTNSVEKRQELALEQLLSNVQKYANVKSIKLGLPEMPKKAYLETQIIHTLEHSWSLNKLNKKDVIQDFITDATNQNEN